MNQTASNRLMMIVCFILTSSLPDLVSLFFANSKSPECDIKDHPYVAAVTRIEYDRIHYHYGAAVLITTEWLITCSNKVIIDYYGSDTDPKSFVVLAGSNFELPTPETHNQSRYIKALHSFKSYVEAKIGPFSGFDSYIYGVEFSVHLIRVDRPFELNEYVRPVKLPPRPDFVNSCGDSALIVGWGQSAQNKISDHHWKSVNDSERDHLRCAEIEEISKTAFGNDAFNIETKDRIYFCESDTSVPIVCNDTLIGLVYSTYEPINRDYYSDSCYSGYLIKNINISYHMTFVHDLTGVEVAFESHPKSLKNPRRKPLDDVDVASTSTSTLASTSTGMFGRRPARTSPAEYDFILNAAGEKRISCRQWMVLTWMVVVFKIKVSPISLVVTGFYSLH